MASLEPTTVPDLLEIEQLLARYAVGMTKDDIDAVMEVFTPDGTYSAFGDTYTLADFPDARRRRSEGPLHGRARPPSSSTATRGTGQQPLCFVDQTNHDMRIGWYTRHLSPDGRRVAAAHPVDDLPPQERRPGLRSAARPHPPRADQQLTEPGTTHGPRRVPDRARRAGSTSTTPHLAPDYAGAGDAGRADGAARPRSSGSPSTPAGCAGAGPSAVGGLGGSTLLRAYLGEALTARDLVEPGIYSHDRGAGARP